MAKGRKKKLPVQGSLARTVVTATCALLGAIILGSLAQPALDQLFQGVSKVLSRGVSDRDADLPPLVRQKDPESPQKPSVLVTPAATSPTPPAKFPSSPLNIVPFALLGLLLGGFLG